MKLGIYAIEHGSESGSGIGVVVRETCEELRKQGHTVYVVTPSGPDFRLGSYILINKLGGLGIILYWIMAWFHILRSRVESDVVWMHQPLFFVPPPTPRGVLLLTFHTTYLGYFRRRKILGEGPLRSLYFFIMKHVEQFSARNLRKCKGVILTAITNEVRAEVSSIFRISNDRIHVIPNGVNTTEFQPCVKNKNLETDSITLCWVGRFHQQKHPKGALEVLQHLVKNGLNARLFMIGKGELLPVTQRIAKRMNLLDRVQFVGRVSQEILRKYYFSSDIFLITSIYEGLPMTFLEAMASALPILTSQFRVLEEIINETGGGWIYDEKDIRSMKEISKDIKNSGIPQIRKLGKKNREFVEKKLSWSRVVIFYIKILSTSFQRFPGENI